MWMFHLVPDSSTSKELFSFFLFLLLLLLLVFFLLFFLLLLFLRRLLHNLLLLFFLPPPSPPPLTYLSSLFTRHSPPRLHPFPLAFSSSSPSSFWPFLLLVFKNLLPLSKNPRRTLNDAAEGRGKLMYLSRVLFWDRNHNAWWPLPASAPSAPSASCAWRSCVGVFVTFLSPPTSFSINSCPPDNISFRLLQDVGVYTHGFGYVHIVRCKGLGEEGCRNIVYLFSKHIIELYLI